MQLADLRNLSKRGPVKWHCHLKTVKRTTTKRTLQCRHCTVSSHCLLCIH